MKHQCNICTTRYWDRACTILALLMVTLSMPAYASRYVESVKFNGDLTPGGTVSTDVVVVKDGSGSADNWGSTRVTWDTGETQCIDHPNMNGFGTDSVSFNVNVPVNPGLLGILTAEAFANNNCTGTSGGNVPNSNNPNLPLSCGISVTVILDESGSINETEEDSVRAAYQAFIGSLKDTGSFASVIEFSGQSRIATEFGTNPAGQIVNVGINPPTINIVFDPYVLDNNENNDDANKPGERNSDFYGNSRGSTNWEDALSDAVSINSGPVKDLVVLITDGDPQTDNGVPCPGPDNLTCAIDEAVDLKSAGSHILAVGVGSDISNNSDSQNNLKAIAGPDLVTDAANFDVQSTDVVIVNDFDDLAENLSEVAFSLCAPSLTISKAVDDNGDGNFFLTDGWEFTASIEKVIDNDGAIPIDTEYAQFEWQEPAPAGIVPVDSYSEVMPSERTEVTGGGGNAPGFVKFEWKPNTVADPRPWDTEIRFVEDLSSQPGFSLVPGVDDDNDDSTLPTGGSFCTINTRDLSSGDIIARYVVIDQWPMPQPITLSGDSFGTCEIFNQRMQDYGDAPASYGTNAADNGPSHAIITDSSGTPTMAIGGVGPDGEDGTAVASAGADTDDTTNSSDEIIPPTLPASYSGNGEYRVGIPVSNFSGAPALLAAWIDFGDLQTADGSFVDLGEQSVPDLAGFITDNGSCVDPINDDGTFTTGNIPDGCSGTAVLRWTGLPILPPMTDFTLDTFIRIRLTTDPAFLSLPSHNGSATDGEVEDHPVTITSTPVTLSFFDSRLAGGKVEFDWGTASELFNVGFQLWALDGTDGQWEAMHSWLVKSGSGNAVEPQSYRKTVNVPGSVQTLAAVGLSSVDSDGSEHYYGPFKVGTRYGSLSHLKPIAWDAIRSENDARMAAKGYVKDQVRGYRKIAANQAFSVPGTQAVVEFGVNRNGMYRITAGELLSAGVDWRAVRKGDIAIMDHTGDAVVRFVRATGSGGGNNKLLGSAGEIYFYANAPDDQAGLYTDTRRYHLIQDRYRALNAPVQGKQGISGGFSESYRELSVVEEDVQYTLNSYAPDPWVSAVVTTQGDSGYYVYSEQVPVEGDALDAEGAVLLLELGRSSGLAPVDTDGDGNADPEHIVQGAVVSGGQVVWLDEQSQTGTGEWSLRFAIPPGTVLDGAGGQVLSAARFNVGPGYAFSQVQVDSIALEYARPYVAKAGEDYLEFSGPNAGEAGYEVRVPDRGWPWVFASDGGNLVRILPESGAKVTGADGSKQRRVRFAVLNGSAGQGVDVKYWVSGKAGYLGVEDLSERQIASAADLLAQAQGADYILVSHPAFMGDKLDSYAAFKGSRGHAVAQVNYLDVVDAFGGGQAGPHGLEAYLEALEAQGDIANVLLVGGSTYDHTDLLGSGAVTYIPSAYGQSGYSRFTPTDTPYITAEDGTLFAAIGRWPVREVSDVNAIVDKSIAWGSADHGQGEALLIAEGELAGEEIDFGAVLDGIELVIPGNWSVDKVYVDQILGDNPGMGESQAISQAQGGILSHLNAAPQLVLYNGHASTSQLSNKGLFKAQHVEQVNTPGAEVWVPMSCYVTYYESTHLNTLAHQLLFTGNAVNITGAMLLSSQATNVGMGRSILDGTLNGGASLGEAVNATKSLLQDPWMTTNWSVLGDPSNGF